MKKKLSLFLKLSISGAFLYLLLSRIDLSGLFDALGEVYLPLAFLSIAIGVSLSALLALRWFLLLRPLLAPSERRFSGILRLTMIGLFFNNFLPSGSGGDIAKVFYLVHGREKRLLLGSSVLIDRYTGALSIISMGLLASLFTGGVSLNIRLGLSFIFFLLILVFVVFTSRGAAIFFYRPLRPILPCFLRKKLATFYEVCSHYFAHRKSLLRALVVSFILQILSIMAQYLMGIALLWKGAEISSPGIGLFFIYIPLIWVATLLPSLGGLGVREYSYAFFFSRHIGEEKAVALSLAFLLVLIIQSLVGAACFIFSKKPGLERS